MKRIYKSMYKVTIQATPVQESNWRVVASGKWKPGEPPELDNQDLSAGVIPALFIPSATDKSGRNQIQDGDTFYAVVFTRLSKHHTA